jgi:hypothetical protein
MAVLSQCSCSPPVPLLPTPLQNLCKLLYRVLFLLRRILPSQSAVRHLLPLQLLRRPLEQPVCDMSHSLRHLQFNRLHLMRLEQLLLRRWLLLLLPPSCQLPLRLLLQELPDRLLSPLRLLRVLHLLPARVPSLFRGLSPRVPV